MNLWLTTTTVSDFPCGHATVEDASLVYEIRDKSLELRLGYETPPGTSGTLRDWFTDLMKKEKR